MQKKRVITNIQCVEMPESEGQEEEKCYIDQWLMERSSI